MSENNPDTFSSIGALLDKRADIHLAYVFGSIARGTATSASDLDIAIKADAPLSAQDKIELIEVFAAATGRAIDLIDLRTAGEPLLGEILRDGVRVKGTKSAHAEVISRHLLDSADFLPYARRILAERRQRWTN